MERHFDEQIENLKTKLIKMGSLVDEQVEFALRSISEANMELASLVIERDDKVDRYDRKIDKICQKLFALNQPVATDLRLIMSSLIINSNLERIGDLAVNIARSAEQLKDKKPFYSNILFNEISAAAREMVKRSIDSFIDNNQKIAETVIKMDDILDDYVKKGCDLLIEIMKGNKGNIEDAVRFYSMYHDLERIGDHSTNIAESVFFIIEAHIIKHRYEDFILKTQKDEEEEI